MHPELWVGLAVAAALAQTTRNAVARSLASRISPALNSWARFTFCLPFAACASAFAVCVDGLPSLPADFFALCLLTALSQLLGNVALIGAFRAGGFGEAIVFHKLEVILTAIVGALFFAEWPSPPGAVGIVVCALGVLAINLAGTSVGGGWQRAFRLGRGASLALLCAALLVVASFALKQASAVVFAANPGLAAAGFAGPVQTLFHTTWMEVAILSAWIGWREPASFGSVGPHLGRMAVIGSMGFAASLGWFWAFSLTLVAYVKAVGQIEVLFAVALAIRLLGERTLIRQIPGIVLVVLGIALVLLG
jgi:drug/metabolite transporter (DMT)-like permease